MGRFVLCWWAWGMCRENFQLWAGGSEQSECCPKWKKKKVYQKERKMFKKNLFLLLGFA